PDGQEIDMVGVDCSIIMNPKVWEASGHVGGFADKMVDCKKCRKRFRADKVFFGSLHIPPDKSVTSFLAVEADDKSEAGKLLEELYQRLLKKKKLRNEKLEAIVTAEQVIQGLNRPCPVPDCDGELTEPRSFNLMFE